MTIKLVAALGNPGAAYALTPHNIGFHVVDLCAERENLSWKETPDFQSAALPLDAAFFIKPKTFMNVSGPVVKKALSRAGAKLEELLVVCDDFALPWGRLRLRRSGSAGGHNGLKSLIEALGSTDFARLRVGVGPVPEAADPKDYVLKKQSRARIEDLAARAAEAVAACLTEGLEPAMNRFNAAPPEKTP